MNRYRYDSVHTSHDILVSSLFKREIDLMRGKNRLLEDIISVSDMSPLELFGIISKNGASTINYLAIKEFLMSHGHYATDDELIAIIRRIDTDNDSIIDYNDFINFITVN